MKMQKIIVGRARSAQHEPGVLIPEDATIVAVSLDGAGEHGQVDFYTGGVVEVNEDDESKASSDDGR